jgi:hypothetical protein
MIPRSRDIIKEALKTDSYWSEQGVFNKTYIEYLKKFCGQFIRALKVEFEYVKTNSLKKVVYCGISDVAYIYLNDKRTCVLLMESLDNWLLGADPTFKGTTFDEVGENYIIELNYADAEIIKRNKENNLKMIAV